MHTYIQTYILITLLHSLKYTYSLLILIIVYIYTYIHGRIKHMFLQIPTYVQHLQKLYSFLCYVRLLFSAVALLRFRKGSVSEVLQGHARERSGGHHHRSCLRWTGKENKGVVCQSAQPTCLLEIIQLQILEKFQIVYVLQHYWVGNSFFPSLLLLLLLFLELFVCLIMRMYVLECLSSQGRLLRLYTYSTHTWI